jgi:hypothetical protein
MFIGVVVTRRKTNSTVFEYHERTAKAGGPNREIVDVANEVARRYSSDWDIACTSLSEYEYKSFVRKLNREKQMVEEMTGVQFEDRGVV